MFTWLISVTRPDIRTSQPVRSRPGRSAPIHWPLFEIAVLFDQVFTITPPAAGSIRSRECSENLQFTCTIAGLNLSAESRSGQGRRERQCARPSSLLPPRPLVTHNTQVPTGLGYLTAHTLFTNVLARDQISKRGKIQHLRPFANVPIESNSMINLQFWSNLWLHSPPRTGNGKSPHSKPCNLTSSSLFGAHSRIRSESTRAT